MQQWKKRMLVLAWNMTIIVARQCPSWFNCSDTPRCYLIPNEIHDTESGIYESPTCYKLIRKTSRQSSCIDTQRECEQVGGNIAVLNSTEEYESLTENVLQILSNLGLLRTRSTFIVQVKDLQKYGLNMPTGCARIDIEYRKFLNDVVDIESIECSTAQMVNTIVCEFLDLNTGICPTMLVPGVIQTTTVQQTWSVWSTVSQPFVTDGTTEKYTSIVFMHPSQENQTETSPDVPMVAIIASIVVITIAIILLVILLMRRSQKRSKRSRNTLGLNQHPPSTGPPIDKDRATVSYSEGGVATKYSTAENHHDRSEAYTILDAKDIHSPTVVVNDVYAMPQKDAATKNSAQDQEYDMLNGMDSGVAKQNGLDGVYAVTNKKSKGRKVETKQDVDEPYDTLDAADTQPALEEHERESDDTFDDALYVNANAHSLQDEGDVYNVLNVADMHSDRDNSGDVYDVPYKETGERQQAHSDVYDMLNGAEVRSDNEYGKLNASDNMPPKNDMYSYVETAVGFGIVTVSPEEDHAYDKLQRNAKLDGASINDNNYISV